MKKQKKATAISQSEKPGTKVLIPLVSRRENSEEFIERACSDDCELFLLLIVDTAAMPGQFGFAASDIAHGNELMEDMKSLAGSKCKHITDIIEWGDTIPKIMNFANLRKINKIFLVKQDNHFFKKLVKELKEKTSAEIIIVQVSGA